jgi:aryl-alcohol dehydrogenase-like predicted oxidoreductase/histidinol phosphatase-like enzyme/predicted kinase
MWPLRGGLPRIGVGCMRLSTAADRDEQRGIAVVHAALDAGVRFFDTADAYAHDVSDLGHNERLIARALESWPGDRGDVVVATKGGMTRPSGHWIPDGRARHLTAACEASRRALGVERIQLYQLHAPDPRTPLATSVRALEDLRRAGLIEAIGLCNVTVGQIEEARAIAPIASIQIELSLWCDDGIMGGVVAYCVAHEIPILAHRPLGGERRRARLERDPALRDLAARHAATPAEIALAALADLSPPVGPPLVVPLPGATRPETPRSIARAAAIALDDEDRRRLSERFSAWRTVRIRPDRPDPDEANGEVVLIMGLPGAGKSTLARRFVADRYHRLNRDEAGGTLRGLVPALERVLAGGEGRIVLDNTYLSRKSRAPVIEAAHRYGRSVRCVFLSTTIEEAQINAVSRLLARHGRLLDEDALRGASRDANAFAPAAQFRMQRALEPPVVAEGFSRIDVVEFERQHAPDRANRALIVWCDGILVRSQSGARTPASPEDVAVIEGRGDVLRRYRDEGWVLVGMSWQPEIAAGTRTAEDVDAAFGRMQTLLGVTIDVLYCPHGAGPPVCWCRKPLPGLGVLAIERHRLDPRRCLFVGAGPQDPGFARRLGFEYREGSGFFLPSP